MFDNQCVSSCREEVRAKGFSVIVDGEVIHDFLLRAMFEALNICHVSTSAGWELAWLPGSRYGPGTRQAGRA